MPAPKKEKPVLSRKIADARTRVLKLNQSEFARALTTTQSNVSKWENGAYRPEPEQLLRLAELLKGQIESLYFLEEAGFPRDYFYGAGAFESKKVAEEFIRDKYEVVNVPLLHDTAAAGIGRAIDEHQVEGYMPFLKSWLPRTGTLIAVRISGRSMSPILEDGYTVLIDISQRDPKKLVKRMVAVREGEGVTIKWLRQDNDLYLLVPQHVSPEFPVRVMRPEGDFSIVGAVVKWIGEPPAIRK